MSKEQEAGREPATAPYGSWRSPITSDLIVSATVGLGDIALNRDDIYWIESRPSDGGRYVIVRRSTEGEITDITPPPFNARSRVHEYGGAPWVIDGDDIYFSNFADGRLYVQRRGTSPQPLTPEGPWRYADGIVDRLRHRLITVLEDHSNDGAEPTNSIACVSTKAPARPSVLVAGASFYSNPRISANGRRLCWLSWNHPNMPWDGTELWAADLAGDGGIENARLIAGGVDESIFQPEWSDAGELFFVSDRTGWWNIYRSDRDGIHPITNAQLEFGAPQWVFGTSTYAFIRPDRIICAYSDKGVWGLAGIDTDTGKMDRIESPYSDIRAVRAAAGRALLIAASPSTPTQIALYDPAPNHFEVLRRSSSVEIDENYISIPNVVEFPTEKGLTAFAFFYAPRNRDFKGPAGERPPLIVISHGGPTAAASSGLTLGIQYWTSRGLGVLDVNYGGSTGFGREYRKRLDGQWGIVDVDDCINGAEYLVRQGQVDGNRLIVRGGSAGGYTTLAALTFRNTFKAGASYFGISDLEALETDGHKFESRYTHRLVAPYPAGRDLYIKRSPIHYVDRLSCPLILFQGLEDKVVPPNQAEMMFDAVRKKGLPVAYLPFEGEQHGFRKAENIKRALDGELYFYSRVFGFELADPVEPVHIENEAAAGTLRGTSPLAG